MHLIRPVLILAFVALPLACSGPGPRDNTANRPAPNNTSSPSDRSDQAKDNIEELASVINLPLLPEEAVWKDETTTVAGGQTRKLTAVLRFAPENAKRMASNGLKNGPATPGTLSTEQWYPAELVSQGDIGGNDTVNAVTYSAAELLKPPFTEGKMSQVEDSDYFIVELYAHLATM